MQNLKIEKTEIKNSQIRFGNESGEDKCLDYADLIEVCLDILPQGGFSPSDIRDRNRIQNVIDKRDDDKKDLKKDSLAFEDADWKNLKKIVNTSRWVIRHKDLQKFLDIFTDKD